MAQWLQCWMPDGGDRLSFGFHNPNHAAALACALLPPCWGWRRVAWAGRTLSVALFAAVADGARCTAWGEDDTRRVMPREAIDPEFLNPLFNSSVAELWRLDAP